MRKLNIFYHYVIISILISSGAYFIEYGLGQKPCILCLYQRIPYFLIILIASIGLKLKKNFFHLIISILFLSSFIIASYHVGVEEKIFVGLKGCQNMAPKPATNIEEMKDIIFKSDQPTCAHADFKMLSISLAGWNAILSAFFAYYSLTNYRRMKNAK